MIHQSSWRKLHYLEYYTTKSTLIYVFQKLNLNDKTFLFVRVCHYVPYLTRVQEGNHSIHFDGISELLSFHSTHFHIS